MAQGTDPRGPEAKKVYNLGAPAKNEDIINHNRHGGEPREIYPSQHRNISNGTRLHYEAVYGADRSHAYFPEGLWRRED